MISKLFVIYSLQILTICLILKINRVNQVYSNSTVMFNQSVIFNFPRLLQIYSTVKFTVYNYYMYSSICILINRDNNYYKFY